MQSRSVTDSTVVLGYFLFYDIMSLVSSFSGMHNKLHKLLGYEIVFSRMTK